MHENVGPDQQPWAHIRSASTTSKPNLSKIKRPRRAQKAQRGVAAPSRLAARYGTKAPVTLTLRVRQGADLWLEVITDAGRFYCAFDVSAFDLVQQVIRGGHTVERLTPALEREHREGKGHLANPT